MSVPERLRNLSDREFFNTAIAMRTAVLRVANGSAIPKSLRFTFAVPMAQSARSVVENILIADAFYPNTPASVEKRKEYLTCAIAQCDMVMQDLQAFIDFQQQRNSQVKIGEFERLVEVCDTEIRLLRGARKNVRLLG